MTGDALRDKIRNECIRKKLNIAPFEDKMRDNQLNWFGHLQLKITSVQIIMVQNVLQLRNMFKIQSRNESNETDE